MYPLGTTSDTRPPGYSYDAVVVAAARPGLLDHLMELRFSGWVGPQEGRWVVLVPTALSGPVAAGGRHLDALAAEVAAKADGPVLAASVRGDRALALAVWDGAEEVGRYLSRPDAAHLAFTLADDGGEDGADDVAAASARMADLAALGDPFAAAAMGGWAEPEPVGVEHADGFAAALGQPEQADRLADLLAEVLDDEEEIESERLVAVLDLFGLPRWLVAAASLPHDVPGGPGAGEFTRLSAGRVGAASRPLGWVAAATRRLPGRRLGHRPG